MEENSNTLTITTRSAGIKFGVISGAVGIAIFLIAVVTGANPFEGVWNWVNIAVSIVLLFLAQKSFKDAGDGFMTFGQGMGIGFWYTIVGSVLSIAVMYVYISFVDTDMMEMVFEQQALKMEEQGQSEEAIEIGMEWTRKLFWPIAFVFGTLGGLFFALILTIFTHKKNPEPTF
jgi:hypothetical protein